MSEQLYEILYTSRATHELTAAELQGILDKAQVNNKKLDVTGMLIFYKDSFVQILEGNADSLQEVFSKISTDKRHNEIKVFYEGPIEEKAFKDWSMKGKILNDDDLKELLPSCDPYDEGFSVNHVFNENPNIGKGLFMQLNKEML